MQFDSKQWQETVSFTKCLDQLCGPPTPGAKVKNEWSYTLTPFPYPCMSCIRVNSLYVEKLI